jgi:uncharacterized protein
MDDLIFVIQFIANAVWRLFPLFVITIFFSTLISALKFDTAIRAAFEKREGVAVLLATLVGGFSPLCSCTVIPVISGLLRSGVPLAPVMAFWIASPTMDPEIFALTVGTLGFPLAMARLLATLALSLVAGYLTLLMVRAGLFKGSILKSELNEASWLSPSADAASDRQLTPAPAGMPASVSTTMIMLDTIPIAPVFNSLPGSAPKIPPPVQSQVRWWNSLLASWVAIDWREFGLTMLKDMWRLGRWIIVAFIIEALITRFVPQAAIAATLGEQNSASVPLAALLGIPLYLSNLSALPIVSGLLAQGMQPGAAIAFLIAGPITTVPAMSAVWGVVKWRVFALYLGISLFGAVILGYIVNFAFR